MNELFNDIREEVRKDTQFWLDMAFHTQSLAKALTMLNDYEKTLTPYEQEYFDFCFQVKLSRLF